jgi:uncharacterized protein (TIGR00375 family)
MNLFTDLHLHSKYSRAVSKNMLIPEMSLQAKQKGIHLLATGDWTHPQWIAHLHEELEEWTPGIYQSKKNPNGAKFLLSTEISCIYSQGGKLRRVHILVFVSSLSTASKVNAALTSRGCNLRADGRPIIGLSCIQLCEVVFAADENALIIPAHAWTPWFGVYGSKGGFDSLSEAFGEYADRIWAIETGLSSDPAMNWRIKELTHRAIVSFGDAHSPAKIGREATVFEFLDAKAAEGKQVQDNLPKFSYVDIYEAIGEAYRGTNIGKLKLQYTVEFYPEEGKYHWDGHRACSIIQPPSVTKQNGSTCPVCGRELTIGVEYRVEELADVPSKISAKVTALSAVGVAFHSQESDPQRPQFVSLVPLLEVIADTYGKKVAAKAVQQEYQRLVTEVGSEFFILLEATQSQLLAKIEPKLVSAILNMRQGKVKIEPGYDGVFGVVKIAQDEEKNLGEELSLF